MRHSIFSNNTRSKISSCFVFYITSNCVVLWFLWTSIVKNAAKQQNCKATKEKKNITSCQLPWKQTTNYTMHRMEVGFITINEFKMWSIKWNLFISLKIIIIWLVNLLHSYWLFSHNDRLPVIGISIWNFYIFILIWPQAITCCRGNTLRCSQNVYYYYKYIFKNTRVDLSHNIRVRF